MRSAVDTRACLDAYRVLFPGEPDGPAALQGLTPATLKQAFRRLALDLHPDRACSVGLSERELTRRFQRVSAAHEVLRRMFENPLAKNHDEDGANGATHASDGSTARSGARSEARGWRRSASATPPMDARHRGGWRGALPSRPLRFAEFLYYTGQISWRDLIDALAWQARARPLFGRLAVERGYLSRAEVSTIILQRTKGQRFGEYAVHAGYMRESERLTVLGLQRSRGKEVGRYFVENRLMSDQRLEGWLSKHREHNELFAR